MFHIVSKSRLVTVLHSPEQQHRILAASETTSCSRTSGSAWFVFSSVATSWYPYDGRAAGDSVLRAQLQSPLHSSGHLYTSVSSGRSQESDRERSGNFGDAGRARPHVQKRRAGALRLAVRKVSRRKVNGGRFCWRRREQKPSRRPSILILALRPSFSASPRKLLQLVRCFRPLVWFRFVSGPTTLTSTYFARLTILNHHQPLLAHSTEHSPFPPVSWPLTSSSPVDTHHRRAVSGLPNCPRIGSARRGHAPTSREPTRHSDESATANGRAVGSGC
nr:hypothetical protein CFP56_12058 [Quercus suber]